LRRPGVRRVGTLECVSRPGLGPARHVAQRGHSHDRYDAEQPPKSFWPR
jgi:hypothetical protein